MVNEIGEGILLYRHRLYQVIKITMGCGRATKMVRILGIGPSYGGGD